MFSTRHLCAWVFASFLNFANPLTANQTDAVTPILPQTLLPFSIEIEQESLLLPSGLQAGATAMHDGKWLYLAGRTNGLHGFDPGNNNFPPLEQNTTIYVIDLQAQTVYFRDLKDPASGLSQEQIDQLSVTSPQAFQSKNTLYFCGGYGVDTATGQFSTKPVLTAIDVPSLMHWVMHPESDETVAKLIRQTSHPLLQVTGGYMTAIDPHLTTLLIFGQNFVGYYTTDSNGLYTEQVRHFQIIDTGKELYIQPRHMEAPNPNYRRRDLNVVPIVRPHKKQAYVALSGVFTLDSGIWTVPVIIKPDGSSSMADPNNPNTFKQGMNNYACPTVGMYSGSSDDMFTVILGGISYGYFQGGIFQTDAEIPFTNEVTTVKIDKKGNFSQYIMNNQYPTIPSQGTNPGNTLLFGAGAAFFPATDLPIYSNGVFKFDKLEDSTVLGYIVGGIMSTLPNTNTRADSTASPYIFRVVLKK